MGTFNERGAGRKPGITEEQLEEIKVRKEQGETLTALAREYKVSRQTLSNYLNRKNETEEQICQTMKKWVELNRRFRGVDAKDYTLRMDFMCKEECCTMILVDFKHEKIEVVNNTDNLIHRAFGIKAKPDWEDFQEFLESRCFPWSRDKLGVVLEDLELDFYDPLMIVEKTKGRMAEDFQWLKLTYFEPRDEK